MIKYHAWEVKLYYAFGVEPPKVAETLAIHTWNVDALSKDMEVAAGSSREDIGRIEVLEVESGKWKTVQKAHEA